MYIHYSTRNNSGPQTLVHIVEVSIIGGVHFWRFHCSNFLVWYLSFLVISRQLFNKHAIWGSLVLRTAHCPVSQNTVLVTFQWAEAVQQEWTLRKELHRKENLTDIRKVLGSIYCWVLGASFLQKLVPSHNFGDVTNGQACKTELALCCCKQLVCILVKMWKIPSLVPRPLSSFPLLVAFLVVFLPVTWDWVRAWERG